MDTSSENIHINKIITFFNNPYFIGLSACASIVSLFLSIIFEGKWKMGALIVLITTSIIIFINVNIMIKGILDEFRKVHGKINEITKNVKCEHNCKLDISKDINNVKDIALMITEKVEKSPETIELIDVTESKFILLVHNHSPQKYKLVIKGRYADQVDLKNILIQRDIDSNQSMIKKVNNNDDSDTEAYFDIQSQIGINLCFFEVVIKNKIEDVQINISIIDEQNKQCISYNNLKIC